MSRIKNIKLPDNSIVDIYDAGSVRFDSEQTLSNEQKKQARENIDASSTDDILFEESEGSEHGIQSKHGNNTAQGNYSFASGWHTQTSNRGEHAEGNYNITNKSSEAYGNKNNTVHSVGVGTSNTNRKNAFEIMQNGDAYIIGVGEYDGTNPASAITVQEVISEIQTDIEEIPEVLTELSEKIDEVDEKVDTKQDILISGQNIKTINNESLLGSGNIELTTDFLIEVTYNELKNLRDNSQLTPGMQYRITDYQTMVIDDACTVGEHQFDIIVIADDESTLNETARAIQHEGDTYFVNSNLAAWEVKYCLDNGTNRFEWANTNNGKGVIYWMKDEFNNECPYDFKNVMFYRRWNSSTSLWSDIVISSASGAKPCYTFSSNGLSSTTSFTDMSLSANNYVYSNVIKEYIFNKKQRLNNNCFFGEFCNNNTFGYNCYSNTFRYNCYSNTFGNNCRSNTFRVGCGSNTFGNGCDSNTFGDDCESNTFGNTCTSNIFGNSCYYNTFGNGCTSNIFGNSCYYNTFGNGCTSNTFGNDCNFNTFGNGCDSNTFGNECHSNTFGNDCKYNTFRNFCWFNTFGNDCDSNTFESDYWCYNRIDNHFHDNDIYTDTEDGSYVLHHHFKSGIFGLSFTVKGRDNDESRATPLIEIEVGINSKGEVVQYCLEDLYKGI